MPDHEKEQIIAIEIGRLNSVVHEVLTELGLATSREERPTDFFIKINRTLDGMLTMTSSEDQFGPKDVDDQLMQFCRMISAGTNLVGQISFRVRMDVSGPVFISMWTHE